MKLIKFYLKSTLSILLGMGFFNGYTQTYVEPIIGISFSKNSSYSEGGFSSSHVVSDADFRNEKISFGGGVTQYLSNRISFRVNGHHSSNSMKYRDRGFVGYTGVKFKRFNVSATVHWRIYGKLEMGIGVSKDKLYNFALDRRDFVVKLSKEYNQKQVGWVTALSYSYSSFLISLQYKETIPRSVEYYSFIEKMKSIELSLAYRFKILNRLRIGRKQVKCPVIK